MADEIDQAQEINERFMDAVLADHRQQQPTGASLTHCIVCEEEIPQARRNAAKGCTRCIDCQALLENWRPI